MPLEQTDEALLVTRKHIVLLHARAIIPERSSSSAKLYELTYYCMPFRPCHTHRNFEDKVRKQFLHQNLKLASLGKTQTWMLEAALANQNISIPLARALAA